MSPAGSAVLYRFLQLLYFIAPAYLANMAAPFARYWHGWNPPIHERWLGSHKTVVGFLLGVVAAIGTTLAQHAIAWPGGIVDYDDWVRLGLAFGVGALGGDAIKSAIKRRIGMPPGARWLPADQLDFVIGALALTWCRAALTWTDILFILAVTFVDHITVDHIAYRLGVRDTEW